MNKQGALMMDIDSMLGREYEMIRWDRGYAIRSKVQVVAYDPDRGWRLWSQMWGAVWVSFQMFDELLEKEVLS